MKALLIATLGASLLYASFGVTPAPTVTQNPTCFGSVCEVVWVCFPDTGWEVDCEDQKDGKGKGPPFGQNCDECLPCKGKVVWSFSLVGSRYVVDGQSGGGDGSGPASGYFNVETHCDAFPYDNKFTDETGGSFTCHLYCNC